MEPVAQPGQPESSLSAIDEWLRGGDTVVAASERAARAALRQYHLRRRAEGLDAWPAPRITAWPAFVRKTWQQYALDARMVLNPTQERALWAQIAAREQHLATLLPQPLERLAEMAVEAHALLCDFAPHLLQARLRAGWEHDAGAFSGWLAEFDRIAQRDRLLSPGRIPVELTAALQSDTTPRRALLLVGFDRLLPSQRAVLDAWGSWRQAEQAPRAVKVTFFEAPTCAAELEACALRCKLHCEANPAAQLLVLCSNIATRRGEIERTFRRLAGAPFEFTLGVPLAQTPLVRGALLALQWLEGTLTENEVDWLFSSGRTAHDGEESFALQAQMRRLRREGLARLEWTLGDFTTAYGAKERLPRAWVERMLQTRRRLQQASQRNQPPRDWAELAPQLLCEAGWPGALPFSSAEAQMLRTWQLTLDQSAALGFDGRRMEWSAFLAALDRIARENLFAPESLGAPIQIAGPAEAAGLHADAVWFLGADQSSWPVAGSTHPFLPLAMQRDHNMPHATAQQEWQLAQQMTQRILRSASEVHFSYARVNDDGEQRPSGLVVELAGAPQALPEELMAPAHAAPQAVVVADSSHVPFAPGPISGGAGALTAQSQCPFKAFAAVRLNARTWQHAEAGLTASQRGLLLHTVLRDIWSGPPHGLRTLAELVALGEPQAFVAGHVQSAMQSVLRADLRARMPQRYLQLEETRLTHLVTAWLAYEATRPRFSVHSVETDRRVSIGGLELRLRADRIDLLGDGSQLVVDYKSGDVSPKSWQLPRPDDVQLPLYAGFAVSNEEPTAGLVFAKVRAGKFGFLGSVRDADALLVREAEGYRSLARDPLTDTQLSEWRSYIDSLAAAFLAGDAAVDPRDYPQTCVRCGLQTLCRVQQFLPTPRTEEEGTEEDGDE